MVTASLSRATIGKELLCRERPPAKNFFAESDLRQRIVKKKICARGDVKKNIGLPRADHQALGKESYLPRVDHQALGKEEYLPRDDHQALGKEADLPRALLSAKSPVSIFLFLRAFFYFCLYFQLQQHIFHKYNTSSTSHISQICHPHHMSHIIIHLNISNPTTHVHLKVLSSSHTSSCHKVLIHDEE